MGAAQENSEALPEAELCLRPSSGLSYNFFSPTYLESNNSPQK